MSKFCRPKVRTTFRRSPKGKGFAGGYTDKSAEGMRKAKVLLKLLQQQRKL